MWGGSAAWSYAQERALEREANALAEMMRSAEAEWVGWKETAAGLESSPAVGNLQEGEVTLIRSRIETGRRRLAEFERILGPALARPDPVGPRSRENLDAKTELLVDARVALARAQAEIEDAAETVHRQERFEDLRQSAATLLASIPVLAEDPAVPEMMDRLRQQVTRFADAGDAENLAAAVVELQGLEDRLSLEYSLVITGGRWRYKDDEPEIRNYYLIVQARDADGGAVVLPIRNEETGETEDVSEWGERVPEEVYDRVREDREDNGIIDEDAFGIKRRGFLGTQRDFPDLGQITRW
jgi:hypothetical protein